MPTKKKSFLIDESAFEKVDKINNPQELEKYLMKLMELANECYDEIYHTHKNNPDIEKFSFCKQNFDRIKSIMESNEKSLINMPLYLEAWISTLYSEVHALNLQPKTIEDLNKLITKIKTLEMDFKQLLTKKSCLDLSNKNSARLLKYIDDFEHTWKTKGKRLLADIFFNFAETLVENLDFVRAQNYFMQSKRLYKNAAANAENKRERSQLQEFASQTNSRLGEIKKLIPQNVLSKKINVNDQEKKLTLHFKKLPCSESKWTIVNAASQSAKWVGIKRKQSLSKEPFQLKAKKQKIDLWTIECEKILDKFKCLNIAIDLAHLSNNTKTFDERKAIAHNNYAIFLIEDLNNKEKNYSYSEKNEFLNKVVELLTKSAEIYKNLNLTEEKNNIEHCINAIRSSLKNLDANINQITKPEDSPSMKTQASRSKSIRSISEKELREFQPILSTRVVYKILKNASLSENNTQNTNPQNKKDFACLSLTRSNE